MHWCLAYAESVDPSQGNDLLLPLICIVSIGVVGAMVFGLILLAHVRGHRQRDVIRTLVIFWGLAAAGSVIYATMMQYQWARERNLQLSSGYANLDADAAPPRPWILWGGLAGVYGGLAIWALSQGSPAGVQPPDEPPSAV